MSEINKYEAPQGYVAVEPEQYYNQSGDCKGCYFNQVGCDFYTDECLSEGVVCWAEGRKDGRDVIFKPVLH